MNLVLGFDFGMKHIGVAVGQRLTGTATPVGVIRAKDGIPHWEEVDNIINQWKAEALIVGIPLNMDGSEQLLTFCARRFADRLAAHTQLPLYTVDERLSSYEAKDRLLKSSVSGKSTNKHKDPSKRIDMKHKKLVADINAMAACILVEQWLQSGS